MKPDWKDAPEWAIAWAVDADGQAFWHELPPEAGDVEWQSDGEVAKDHLRPWDKTLEFRPTPIAHENKGGRE